MASSKSNDRATMSRPLGVRDDRAAVLIRLSVRIGDHHSVIATLIASAAPSAAVGPSERRFQHALRLAMRAIAGVPEQLQPHHVFRERDPRSSKACSTRCGPRDVSQGFAGGGRRPAGARPVAAVSRKERLRCVRDVRSKGRSGVAVEIDRAHAQNTRTLSASRVAVASSSIVLRRAPPTRDASSMPRASMQVPHNKTLPLLARTRLSIRSTL